MKLKDAFEKRDSHQELVKGKYIPNTDRVIRHVLVATKDEISKVISNVIMNDQSNELAIAHIDKSREDFDVWVLNDEGSWGDNVQFYMTLDSFLKKTNIGI